MNTSTPGASEAEPSAPRTILGWAIYDAIVLAAALGIALLLLGLLG